MLRRTKEKQQRTLEHLSNKRDKVKRIEDQVFYQTLRAWGRMHGSPDTEEDEYADERAKILAESLALKNYAKAWRHPELGVLDSDPTSFGRNYFNRASAPDTEDMEGAAECARVLADAKALKSNAVDFMHPEVGVTTTDGTACGRNYFDRASAPDVEEIEDERASILAEAAAHKKQAIDYRHPEVGVTESDPTSIKNEQYISSTEMSLIETFLCLLDGSDYGKSS